MYHGNSYHYGFIHSWYSGFIVYGLILCFRGWLACVMEGWPRLQNLLRSSFCVHCVVSCAQIPISLTYSVTSRYSIHHLNAFPVICFKIWTSQFPDFNVTVDEMLHWAKDFLILRICSCYGLLADDNISVSGISKNTNFCTVSLNRTEDCHFHRLSEGFDSA